MDEQTALEIARLEALRESMAVLLKYIIVEGTWPEQLRVSGVLSAYAREIAMRKDSLSPPLPLPKEASNPSAEQWAFVQRQHAREQGGKCAPWTMDEEYNKPVMSPYPTGT